MKSVITYLLLLILFLSCSKDEKVIVFTRDEVIKLLTADTSKTWSRYSYRINGSDAEVNECVLRQQVTFFYQPDSLYFLILPSADICDPGSYEIRGRWDVLEDPQINDRYNQVQYVISNDTLVKQIGEISSLYLDVSFSEAEDVFTEKFQVVE